MSITSVLAQGPPPPPDGGGGPGNTEDIVPIDEHIWVLVLLAVIFGSYFILSKRSSSN